MVFEWKGEFRLWDWIGLNVSSIYAAPGQTFVASDFIGKSNEWNYGLGIGGFQGGNKNSNDFSFDGFLNYGSFYTEKGASYAFPLGPKFGVWWSNPSTVRW